MSDSLMDRFNQLFVRSNNVSPNSLFEVIAEKDNTGRVISLTAGGRSVMSDLGVGGVIVGSLVSGATAGSILFAGVGGALAQDNTNLFFNSSSKQLFVGGPSVVIGKQGVQTGSLLLCNAHTLTSIPNAYMGIFSYTGTWTNNGTYESQIGKFGWNMLQQEAGEPSVGMEVEQKYAQGVGSAFGTELHLTSLFPDGQGVRMFTTWVNRAAPHDAHTGLAGEITFTGSPGGDLINGRLYEGGGTSWWRGTAVGSNYTHNFNNWIYNADITGKGSLRITPADDYPNFGFLLGGSEKAAIFVDMTESQLGNMFLQLRTPGASLHVRGGPLVIDNGYIQTDAPSNGTAAAWKLGVASSVTPTAPNRTIEVDVGGVTLYVAAKTTND